MKKCQAYHGNKLKVGNSTMLKVEMVADDDDNTCDHIFFPNIPIDTTNIPEQDMIDNDGKSVRGLNHVVDSYINMEVRLSSGEKELYRQVFGLCLDRNGRMIRNPDNNLYINTVLYEIKFEDETSAGYGANIIAENMWRICNNEGFYEDSLHLIVEIRFCKNAVKDGLIYNRKGKCVLKKLQEESICCVQ